MNQENQEEEKNIESVFSEFQEIIKSNQENIKLLEGDLVRVQQFLAETGEELETLKAEHEAMAESFNKKQAGKYLRRLEASVSEFTATKQTLESKIKELNHRIEIVLEEEAKATGLLGQMNPEQKN